MHKPYVCNFNPPLATSLARLKTDVYFESPADDGVFQRGCRKLSNVLKSSGSRLNKKTSPEVATCQCSSGTECGCLPQRLLRVPSHTPRCTRKQKIKLDM